jgi:hypothetical protein
MDVPDFTADGVLPAGDYAITVEQLKDSKLVLGPGLPKDHPTWDASWRLKLVENLSVLYGQLCSIGITEVYVRIGGNT